MKIVTYSYFFVQKDSLYNLIGIPSASSSFVMLLMKVMLINKRVCMCVKIVTYSYFFAQEDSLYNFIGIASDYWSGRTCFLPFRMAYFGEGREIPITPCYISPPSWVCVQNYMPHPSGVLIGQSAWIWTKIQSHWELFIWWVKLITWDCLE